MRQLIVFIFAIAVVWNSLCVAFDLSPDEEREFRRWAQNATRLSGWDFSAHPCTWIGISCVNKTMGAPFDGIETVTIFRNIQGSVMYGELPNLDLWEQYKMNGTGFTQLKLLNFTEYRTGPHLPDWVDRMWTNGNDTDPKYPWNFVIDIHASTGLLCPLPYPFNESETAKVRNIGCTNINIVRIDPTHGPKTGGTKVTVAINAPLGFVSLFCSFGHLDGLTVPVPVTELYFEDYYWHDYDPAGNTPSQMGLIIYATSIIRCTSPPHPAGAVDLRIYAQTTDGEVHLLTRDPYKTIFNYECPPGTRSVVDENNAVVCIGCPAGMWSPKASTMCYPCAKGSFSNVESSETCTFCPAGTFGNMTGQVNESDCYPCNPGSFSTNAGSSSCTPCEPGTAQARASQVSCVNCRAGSIAPGYGNINCTTCDKGSYSVDGTNICVLCPIGTFSPADGASVCRNCAPGTTTSNLGGTSCNVICEPGYFRSTDVQRCVECPPGRFSNGTGLAVCQLCPTNTYNPYPNATNCEPCEEGFITLSQGATECFKKNVPAPRNDNIGLIIGIICLVLALIGIFAAIIWIAKKRQEQVKKQREIDEIRKIMDGHGPRS